MMKGLRFAGGWSVGAPRHKGKAKRRRLAGSRVREPAWIRKSRRTAVQGQCAIIVVDTSTSTTQHQPPAQCATVTSPTCPSHLPPHSIASYHRRLPRPLATAHPPRPQRRQHAETAGWPFGTAAMEISLPRPPSFLFCIHTLASERVTSPGARTQSEDKVVFPAPRNQSRQFNRARLLPEFPYQATGRGAGCPQGRIGWGT